MAQYKIGTISITSGTNVVTGVGTLFLANVSVGDSFKVTGVNALYGVIAVDSNTQIRISPNYAGANVVAGQYQITSDFTVNLNLAEISAGDSEVAFHLTHEVIRKLDSIVAGKAAVAGPGSAQAFSVGALTAAGGVLSSSGTQGVHLSSSENSINYGYGQNADALTYINLYGYQNGVSRFRSLEVRDGKAGLIAHFDGPTGRVFVGSGVDNGSGAKLQVSGVASANVFNALSPGLNSYNPALYNGASARMEVWATNGTGSMAVTRYSAGASHEALFGTVQEAGGTAAFVWQGWSGTAYAERMRLSANGSLLVGTNTDNGSGAKLQVAANISALGAYLNTAVGLGGVLSVKGVNNAWAAVLNGTSTVSQSYGVRISAGTNVNDANFQLTDASGATNYFTVNGAGTVMINTGTDNGSGAKLQVNGGITATGSFVLGCPAGSPPILSVNSSMTAYLFNNTTLVFQARGSDGVTRSASLTLA